MTKRTIATGLLAVLLALTVPAAAHAALSSTARAGTVVLVLAPYLRWEDVLSGPMPQTRLLADESAIANMNVRSLLPDAGHPSPDAGALMLSAGTWARYDASGPPPDPLPASSPAVLFPGLAVQKRANARENATIRPGALGEAIIEAGGITAAIGNGDGAVPSRPAALVAMDAAGRVTYGDISTSTTVVSRDDDVALGRLSDPTAILDILQRVLGDAHGQGPTLVVIDPGDLSRAHVAARGHADEFDRLDRETALGALDGLIADVRQYVPSDGVLIVAAPVAAESGTAPSGFGPLIVSGPGWSGTLVSGSTRTPGLVTQADLTATILGVLGVRVPAGMAGRAIVARPSQDVGSQRIVSLASTDGFMRAVDTVRPGVLDVFIAACAVLIVLGVVLVASHAPAALARGTQIALLALLSIPVASILMYVVVREPQTPVMVVAALLATASVACVLDIATHHASGHPRAVAFIALATVEVTLIDQWLGAPLSSNGLFGYSPLVGARYYGLGNEGAALAVGTAITGCALLFDTYADRQWTASARRVGFPLLGIATVLTASMPMLGANVGVAVWGTFAFALAWWGMRGRKPDWKVGVGLLAVVIALLAVLAAADLLATEAPTHFGRSITAALQSGPGELGTLLARKAATNVRVSLQSAWSALFIVLALALAYARVRPPGVLRDLLIERPTFAAALSACLGAAVISYLTEDSGIVVPALLLLFPAVAVVYLMLGSGVPQRRGS